MELHQRADGVTVINDSYNANPDSMRAAVETLAEFGTPGSRQTWAVLGDMLELGDSASAEHEAIGRFVAERGIDHLVAVGEYAARLADGARTSARQSWVQAFDAKVDAGAAVIAGLAPGDVVLVKASRGLALNTVADDILAAVPPRPGPEATS
jgi:UDP-N-acetylmuramoyl-tripeptide--D-alanyl-D-alanine ligase